MTGGAHMAQVLRATGLYTLPGDTPADWEQAAYCAGLDSAEAELDTLEQSLFALTAPAEALARWEALFRSQASSGELGARRRGVAKALGLRFRRPTLGAIQEEVLPAAGIAGTVAESQGKLTITGTRQGVTEAEARRLLDRLLPAHMEWELVLES